MSIKRLQGGGLMSTREAFWIDHEYDREHAGIGSSRYANAIRSRAKDAEKFDEAYGDISPVSFACTAWRYATEPILSPGFVRWNRRILAAVCVRNDWDGGLIGGVNLVSPWPAELTWSREWWRDRGWRDWPRTFGQYLQPTMQDLSRNPYLRASIFVEAPLPLGSLPEAPEGPTDDVEGKARHAVIVLVREFNELLTPIIRQLESGVPAGSR
jgi:hypothetical protein